MIVVALDIEGCAEGVVDEAQRLAVALGEPLHLMTALQLPRGVAETALLHGAGEGKRPSQLLIDDAKEQLEALAAPALAQGVDVHTSVRFGSPVETVLETAESMGARMLVVGSHGRRGIARLLLGSVAEQILRASHVPVVVVPGGDEPPHPSAIRQALRAEADG